MTIKKTLSLNELDSLVNEILKKVTDKTIVLLEGPLGSGKTFLVGQLLNKLGLRDIQSPTYSLIHQYETPQFGKIYHIDLYRITSNADLVSTGFWDIFENKKALIFVEWPDKIGIDDLPIDWKKIKIEIQRPNNEEKRKYIVTL